MATSLKSSARPSGGRKGMRKVLDNNKKSAQRIAIDQRVGLRLLVRRLSLGLSQQDVAEAIGKTFQQVAKYEHGRNGVPLATLVDLAYVLGVPITFFFEELSEEEERVVHWRYLLNTLANIARVRGRYAGAAI